MSHLIEHNPKVKECEPKPMKVKRKLKVKKIVSLLVVSVVIVSIGKHEIGTYKKKHITKQEEANAKVLMYKQQEEETARIERIANSKVAYLTFDDGPNRNTEKILNILKENNIKATFFLVGSMIELNPDIVKKIKDDGHVIANHTYSHAYTYKTKESFLEEIENTDTLISKVLGEDHKSYFVRVPGGSMGKKIPQEVIKENGYKSINWTAVFGDDEKGGKVTSDYILNRVKETTGDNKYEVILAHGTKSITVEVLQAVIDNLKEDGYIFEPLMEDSPVDFS